MLNGNTAVKTAVKGSVQRDETGVESSLKKSVLIMHKSAYSVLITIDFYLLEELTNSCYLHVPYIY
jgi:hypothetical protein